jgi:hypothetical protein
MDIDFLGRIENSVETLVKVTREICQQEVEPDGIVFDVTNINKEQRGTAPIYPARLGLPRGNTTSCLPSNSSIFLRKLSSPQGLPFFVLSLSVFTS